MTILGSEMLDQMEAVSWEPTRLSVLMQGWIERAFDGEELVADPAMPFPHLQEIAIMTTIAAIDEDRILTSQQYPELSQFESDLFRHASDVDYENMFSTPGQAWFLMYFTVDEILQYAVQVGTTTTRQLTIPRYTQVMVNNTPFTFQYPINFIVKAHGGIEAVYDGTQTSPLQALSGNKVSSEEIEVLIPDNNKGPVKFIKLRVPLMQMLLTTYKHSLVGSKVLLNTVTLSDNFYYARAFVNDSLGVWKEIKTTHSQQVFNATDPTLLLTVIGNELTYELPYVYYATDLVKHDIRVDVYTTKGPLNMPLGGLEGAEFVVEWRDLDKDSTNVYIAPLNQMSTISVLSQDTASGGSLAPTFQVRRDRVLNNSGGPNVIPISNAQVGTRLEELGFDAMMNIDDLGRRTYLATRAMPDNTKGQVTTGIDSAVVTYKSTMEDLLKFATVIDNGERITVTPQTLYRYIDGVLSIVTDAEAARLSALKGDALVTAISDGTYLYTPLHYVLDLALGAFHARPYFLSAPVIEQTSFIAANNTLGISVFSSANRTITKTDDGYTLRLSPTSNDVWKALRDDQVHVQLAFTPPGESQMAYINGVQVAVSGERVFEFKIKTKWDIQAVTATDHRLITTNFNMFEPIEREYATALTNDFSLIWSVSDYAITGAETTEVDKALGKFLLPDGTIGAYHETLRLHLGDELTGLWSMSRAMIGARKYVLYEEDVPKRWASDQYVLDPVSKLPEIETLDDGTKRLKVLYPKGDVILTADGEIDYLHRVGDVVLENGVPKLESERKTTCWWDIVLFDGVYRFVTDVNDVAYRHDVPTILVEWINDTLGEIRKNLLDVTTIYFQPRNTLKYVECLVEDSERVTLHTAQFLRVDLFVTKDVYANSTLRAAMEKAAIAQVVAGLNSSIVARNQLEQAITNNLGVDILSVELTGLGGVSKDYNLITLLDESARLCLGKALTTQPDGTFAAVDAIEINFKRHASDV